jgi:hypothetical protein
MIGGVEGIGAEWAPPERFELFHRGHATRSPGGRGGKWRAAADHGESRAPCRVPRAAVLAGFAAVAVLSGVAPASVAEAQPLHIIHYGVVFATGVQLPAVVGWFAWGGTCSARREWLSGCSRERCSWGS